MQFEVTSMVFYRLNMLLRFCEVCRENTQTVQAGVRDCLSLFTEYIL